MWLLAHYCTPADPVKVREGGEGRKEREEREVGREVGRKEREEREVGREVGRKERGGGGEGLPLLG